MDIAAIRCQLDYPDQQCSKSTTYLTRILGLCGRERIVLQRLGRYCFIMLLKRLGGRVVIGSATVQWHLTIVQSTVKWRGRKCMARVRVETRIVE